MTHQPNHPTHALGESVDFAALRKQLARERKRQLKAAKRLGLSAARRSQTKAVRRRTTR